MHGLASGLLERRGDATVLTRQVSRYPLRVFQPQRPAGLSGALIMLGMVAGGIQQGDRLEVDLELARGTQALITTQSASKILTMRGGCAHQQTQFILGDGAILEYLPDEVIPFAASSFIQETRVQMASSAVLIFTDQLSPGRTARGEHFGYHSYVSRLQIERDGQLVLRDVADLRPAEMALTGVGLFGETSHYATLTVVAPDAGPVLADELHAALAPMTEVFGSASAGNGLVVARMLGPSAPAVKAALTESWRVARNRIIGSALPNVPGKIVF